MMLDDLCRLQYEVVIEPGNGWQGLESLRAIEFMLRSSD